MEPVLAHTNITMPQPREAWIPRQELLGRLQGADTPLLLVRAPAGYGKSTLLAQYAHQSHDRVVGWVGLDESDNNPVVFWRVVLAALREALPRFADSASVELNGPAPRLIHSVIPRLVNALSDTPDRVLLVLDDYQFIDDATIHASMRFFLSHLPESTQAAIASRSVPGFSVSRMRVHGMMTELLARDLNFNDLEIQAALRHAGWDDSEASVAETRALTEGWPAGVYLATLGERPRIRAKRDVAGLGVRDFLMDEMLNELSAEDREFLRMTSILDRLNGSLCDYVTKRSRSSETLDSLAATNLLLVPLDDHGEWFRYHSLLQRVLHDEFTRADPDRVPRLHLLASEWFVRNGSPSEAIDHALSAGELVRAAELACANVWEFYRTGRSASAETWFGRLPDRVFTDFPPVAVAGAFAAAFAADFRRAGHLCAVAEDLTFAGPTPDGHSSFESFVAYLRSNLYPSGVTDARKNGQLAYSLEPPPSPWRPYAAVGYGSALLANGELDSAITYLAEAAASTDPGLAAYALGQLAVLYIWEDEWDQADRCAMEALALTEQHRLDNMGTYETLQSLPSLWCAPASAAAAAVAARAGDRQLSRKHLRSMAAALSSGFPHATLQTAILAAETSLQMGDVSSAANHTRAGVAALEILGDGGYYADRLAKVTTAIDQAKQSLESLPEPERLTAREQQVLNLLTSELTMREIGQQLYLSRNTVKTHTRRIYRKLGVRERDKAVTRARELGILRT